MFKALSAVLLIFLAIGAFYAVTRISEVEKPLLDSPSAEVLSDGEEGLKIGAYRIVWYEAATQKLSLIPNFSEKKTSKTVYEEFECKLLINGGFYSEESSPIGYFVADGQELSTYSKNSLFNGILSVNDMGTPRITRQPPRDPLIGAVQTGPIVYENGTVVTVTGNKPDRRMLAAVTGSNELIFMAAYSPGSAFSGPRLSELPELISKFRSEANINIADAINLDGGSASAFITPDFSLSEASPVGSFFCAK